MLVYDISHMQVFDILRGKHRTDITKNYNLDKLMQIVLNKITKYEAKLIKEDLKIGCTIKSLMIKYNRSRYQISCIKNGKTFKNV